MSSITAKTQVCIIIGDPVEHSLSPLLHNSAYEHLGINDKFVFVASKVDVSKIKTVIEAVRVMGIRGLTCTVPHKTAVIPYLDWIDPLAKKIGAVNTVVNDSGTLKGYNTDWLGTVVPLKQITSLSGKKIAVFGAGGAAKAMAFGTATEGAHVTVLNRTISKAQELAAAVGGQALHVDDAHTLSTFDIILNATTVGMDSDQSPIPKEYLRSHHIVFDAVYSPLETQLLKDAKEIGATTIYGTEMLLHQGTAQFELYTNQKAPEEYMKKILYTHFAH